MHLLHGDRIGRTARLSAGTSAAIFDAEREKILLTRRADNGQWCMPGGMMEPGENFAEACAREVREETGLEVRVARLIGVYTDPHRIVEYADGNRFQFVVLHFEVEAVGGALGTSDEVTEYGYFTPAQIVEMDILASHRQRIADSFANQTEVLVRNSWGDGSGDAP